MRYLELRRHLEGDGHTLTEEGVAAAERIGQTGLRPPYTLFASTGAERADQTVKILRRAAGQDELPILAVPGLRSAVEDRWREVAKAAGKGADLEAMRALDPDLVYAETRLLGPMLREIVDALPEGGRALVVGHSPTNEAAVLGLTGQLVAPLGKGEGVLVTEGDGTFDVQRLD